MSGKVTNGRGRRGTKELQEGEVSLPTKVIRVMSDHRLLRDIDLPHILDLAAKGSVLSLAYPDTLVPHGDGTATLIYTDSDSILRSDTGPHASDHFLQLASKHRKAVPHVSPSGVFYPKFVVCAGGKVVETLFTKAEARGKVRETLQRYVVPKDYVVRKMVVRWRRTKVTKAYWVSARGKRGKEDTCDPSFLASVRLSPGLPTPQESHLPQSIPSLLSTVRSLLHSYYLPPATQLEELIVSIVHGQDNCYYLLQCNGVRTSPAAGESVRIHRPPPATLEEIAERLEMQQPTPLPRLSVPEKAVLAETTHNPALERSSPLLPDGTAALISDHISSVAQSLDQLTAEAKSRKQEFATRQDLQFASYPTGFLPACIHRFYTAVAQEPRLMKFFPRQEGALRHIEKAVSLALRFGCDQGRLAVTHGQMGISDSDFSLFVKLFAAAMVHEGGAEADIEKAKSLLEAYRALIVARPPAYGD